MYELLDSALLLGMTLRMTRFITSDTLGEWWIRDPADAWVDKHKTYVSSRGNTDEYSLGWRGKLVSGLECPFCIGFWIGLGACVSLELAGGPGQALEWWRWFAGVFTLNYIVGHISGRAD